VRCAGPFFIAFSILHPTVYPPFGLLTLPGTNLA
jgi:hypothetical protein